MPAMPLMSVLLPAPLSPTSAVTLPAETSRSTPRSTWTAPKLLLMPRSCSSGPLVDGGGGAVDSVVVVDTEVLSANSWTARRGSLVVRVGHPAVVVVAVTTAGCTLCSTGSATRHCTPYL